MGQRAFDLIAWLLIGVLGIIAGVIAFGLLESQANVNNAAQSVGGAAAGMLLIWGTLGSLYLQIRKSGGELEALREENQALQQQLIRGAPRPNNYLIEVDDRQRLVLARPAYWKPRGGVIFEFEQPPDALAPGDLTPAWMTVSFEHLEGDTTPDEYYSNYVESFATNPYVNDLSSELIYLGANNDLRSLKVTFNVAGKAERAHHPVVPHRQHIYWTDMTMEEFEQATKEGSASSGGPSLIAPEGDRPGDAALATAVGEESDEETEIQFVWVRRMIVVCVNENLERIFFFEAGEDLDGYQATSEVFNQVLDSVRFLS